jgi:hypothetical protein
MAIPQENAQGRSLLSIAAISERTDSMAAARKQRQTQGSVDDLLDRMDSIELSVGTGVSLKQWQRYNYLSVPFTAQNEFFGDQTTNVVALYTGSSITSVDGTLSQFEFDQLCFYLSQTNAACITTGNTCQLQYWDGSNWQNESGALLTIVGVTAPVISTGWRAVSSAWQTAAASAPNGLPIRALRSISDAATDIPSIGVYFRKSFKYIDYV